MTIKKLAIIQARMSSSRLPGKVLMLISGRPMLEHVIERARNAKAVDDVALATTIDPSDDGLAQLCSKLAVPCYRGSPMDVLDRFYQTALQFHPEAIIRLTADCPLLDPNLIDLTLLAFLGNPLPQDPPDFLGLPDYYSAGAQSFDFAANRLPPPWKRTIPIGLDVEVCSFSSLERAWKEADQVYQREHVMPYLYEGVSFPVPDCSPKSEWYIDTGTSQRGFRVSQLNHYPDYGSLRWTVDTQADLEFVRQIYEHFEGQPCFSWRDVLDLVESQPELASINADVKHKSAFDVDKRKNHS